jgi:hypothetical protein
MTATRALLVSLLTLSASARGADQQPFADLAGVYLSSILSGCSLELKSEGSFTIACPSRAPYRGEAIVVDGGFLLPTSGKVDSRIQESQAVIGLVQPQQPSDSTWPPSLADPTRGPFVFDGRGEADFSFGETLWLKPLRWGSRLYLVAADDDEAFCRAIRNGVEPRRSPIGQQFLRRGDHRKPAGRRPPAECATPKQ